MVSRCLSAAGISFCGHPSPARDSAPLTIGLPAQPRRTATGYHVPHMRDATGVGALFTPGPAVLTRAGDNPRPAACRLSTARVLSPRYSRHPSGAASYEASVKGSRDSPARPSPHPWPPDDSGNPPAFPGLRTHASRTRARTPGRGQAQSTSPELRRQHYVMPALQSARFTHNMCDLASHDGVPGGFGGVLAAGGGGSAEGSRGDLLDFPARVLLEPVVVTALCGALDYADVLVLVLAGGAGGVRLSA